MCKPCVHDLLNHKRFTTVPLYLKKGRKKKLLPVLHNIPRALSCDTAVELILISWKHNLSAGKGSGIGSDVI